MEALKQDVFISYARKDYLDENGNEIPGNPISLVMQRLEKEGISYWFDKTGIYSGHNFVDKIVTNIELSRTFLFLSTENANASDWTCKEIASAAEFGKPIIPVRLDNTPYNRRVLFRIADLDYISCYLNPEKGLDEMVDAIKQHLQEQVERERRQREELERRQAEMQRRKAEEERRKAEEERRRQEEQQQLVNAIRIKCKELQTDAAKLDIEWKRLSLETERIEDAAKRKDIQQLIVDSRPKDAAKNNDAAKPAPANDDEFKRLKDENETLRKENTKLTEKCTQLQKIAESLVHNAESFKVELEKTKQELLLRNQELARLRLQTPKKR